MSNFSGSSSRGVVDRNFSGFNDHHDAGRTVIQSGQHGVLGADDILIPGAAGQPTRFKRRVVKQQEIPYMRKVKVPVFTKKVVPTTFKKRIKTKKLVPKQKFRMVEEKYTVLNEVQKTRTKKVWRQENRQEPYTRKVPEIKTRMVKKPVLRIQEEVDFQLVTIQGTKMIDVHGWRIDEIEERKLIEIEEFDVYELLPHHTGKTIQGMQKDLGRMEATGNRKIGQVIYAQGDLNSCGIDWTGIEVDDNTATEHVSRIPLWKNQHGQTSYDSSQNGYTSITEWNSQFKAPTRKAVAAPAPKPYVPWSLPACLEATSLYLSKNYPQVDYKERVEEIEERWRHVDDDMSGLMSYGELRTAVWRREPDNRNPDGSYKPEPAGDLPTALQDVLDQIWQANRTPGRGGFLTYWKFASYVVEEEHPELSVGGRHFAIPQPRGDQYEAEERKKVGGTDPENMRQQDEEMRSFATF